MFPKSLRNKINFLTEITCWDHCKTRDFQYGIEVIYSAYDDECSYFPYHNGYIWDTDKYKIYRKKINTFEEACTILEEIIDEVVAEQFLWFEKYLENPLDYDVYGNPVLTKEDLSLYRNRWKHIQWGDDVIKE